MVAAPAWATSYVLSEYRDPSETRELVDGQPVVDEGPPLVFGNVEHYTAKYEDTLTDIARRFSLGYEEIVRANPGVDPWLPGEGTDILIPGRRILPNVPQEGIVINLPEHRLYYFPKQKRKKDPRIVITYPVSIGKMDWHTPLGETRIATKEKNPLWYPPESVRKEHRERGDPLPAVVGPGPDNPLGAYKMRLAIPSGAYLIHGTNNPLAVGMAVTHGCMRMYPEDIEALFPLVPIGTKVRIINEPIKTALVDGELLLEAHPPVDAEGQVYEPDLEQFAQQLDQALGESITAIHWGYARDALQVANGLPTVVGLEADLNPVGPDGVPLGPDGLPLEGAGAPMVDASGVQEEPAQPLVRSLPAPLPPADDSQGAPASGSARTFGAGDPARVTATAEPTPPAAAVAPADPAAPVSP